MKIRRCTVSIRKSSTSRRRLIGVARFSRILSASLTMMVLCGCNTISNGIWSPLPRPEQESDSFCENLLAVDGRGRQVDYYQDYCRSKLLPSSQPYPRQPGTGADGTSFAIRRIGDALRGRFKDDNKVHLIVFFHGGLTSTNQAIEKMRRDIAQIVKDSQPGAENFPIFVSWPTDLKRSYLDAVGNALQGFWEDVPIRGADSESSYRLRLVKSDLDPLEYSNWLAPLRLAGDAAEAVLYAPTETIKSIGRYIAYRPVNLADFSAKNSIEKQDDACEKMKEAFKSDIESNELIAVICGETKRPGGVRYWSKEAISFAALPTKPISMGVMHPVGKRAWKGMLARARFAMRHPCKSSLDMDYADGDCEPGAVAELFDEINAIADEHRDRLQVTLIGHSMGTIVANSVVAKYPCLPYRDVVFMGAAISIQEFNDGIGNRMLLSECDDKTHFKDFSFYNLSLHPEAEALGKEYLGVVPSGSLLEWIDDIFESPVDLGGRTLGKWSNVSAALCQEEKLDRHECQPLFPPSLVCPRGFKPDCVARMHFKRFSLSNDQPLLHGEFGLGAAKSGKSFHYWNPKLWQ